MAEKEKPNRFVETIPSGELDNFFVHEPARKKHSVPPFDEFVEALKAAKDKSAVPAKVRAMLAANDLAGLKTVWQGIKDGG
jgi:hypothetical protein